MLTKLICRNFKNLEEVNIELGNPVVFIGPNNSGKTTALQALALWDIGSQTLEREPQGETETGKTPRRCGQSARPHLGPCAKCTVALARFASSEMCSELRG